MAVADDRARYEARVGTMLGGKWKLDRLIGIGGMAAVYAASHRNGATAAIKVLHAQFARRADARTRFLREAYIANKAGKGAVAVVDDDVDDDGAPYLVMDLLLGEAVDVRAKRLGGTLPLPEVLWIANEVLVTLEHAHAHGIIHRDLKPDNLFWTTDSALKLLDFGVARLRDENTTETTRTGTVVGTPTFMSPEQAIGSVSEIDARSDLWSLGAIMFRLLTGMHVHPSTDVNALVIAATKRARPITTVDPKIPLDVANIIDTALQFERDERFPNAQAMREALDLVVSKDPARKGRISGPRMSIVMAAMKAEPLPEAEHGFATGMSDLDSLALRDLLRLVGDAVQARAAHGPAQPKTIRTVDVAYRQAVRALVDAHIGLFWNVVPEGFVAGGQLVWMAKPPLPRSPEKMHEDGLRMLGLLPGITKSEFEEVVRMIGGDLAPFSDYATFLHSSQIGHVVYRIDAMKPGMPENESISLEATSGEGVQTMLDALRESEDGAVRVTLLSRLERWGEGHELEIGAALETASVEVAMGLLRVLHVLGTPLAKEAMEKAASSPDAFVRIVALSYLEAGDRLKAELLGPSAQSRLDALVGIERYRIVPAAPALEGHIRAPTFEWLPIEERRQALSALGALAPSRAEEVAIEILANKDGSQDDETRAIAAELLGVIGASPAAGAVLAAAAASRKHGVDTVGSTAVTALTLFESRAALAVPGDAV